MRALIYQYKIASKKEKATVFYPLIKSLYLANWHMTWQLDELFRMQGYNYLREKGHSPREAAQAIAELQGDYASIPPKTRKWLNRFFFTPTFKLATIKLYAHLIKNSVQVMNQIIRHPLSWKDSTTKKQRRYFYAAAGVVMVNYVFDLIMTKTLGFERDTWGRRYRKKILDEMGNKKDFWITFSSPENLIQRFVERYTKSFTEPGVGNPMMKFIQMNKWEIHPVHRNAISAVTGQGDEGRVFSDFDSASVKFAKGLWYFTRKTFNILDAIQSKTDWGANPEERKQVSEAWVREYGEGYGYVANALEAIFGFAYLSEPEGKRLMIQLKGMKNEYVREALEDIRKKGAIDPTLIKKYMEQQKAILNKYSSLQKGR
jgi:hypothetical protein